MWKYCVLTHKRHCPARIRVCWCIACKNRFNGLSSRSVEIFLRTKEERKKIWVVTFAIWGEVTPRAILTKCGMWADMVDVITCAIFGDLRWRGVSLVRWVTLLSAIDYRCVALTASVTLPCDSLVFVNLQRFSEAKHLWTACSRRTVHWLAVRE